MLSLCGVEPESIVDGPGFRYVLFAQGCPHLCPGCHNPESHPFSGGQPLDEAALLAELAANPMLAGVTFSGGEPFCQAQDFADLAKKVHALGKSVVSFTGYTYEALCALHDPAADALLAQTDLLVDGPYIEAERDLTLLFRGSRNQRLLRLEHGKIAAEGDAAAGMINGR